MSLYDIMKQRALFFANLQTKHTVIDVPSIQGKDNNYNLLLLAAGLIAILALTRSN